MNRENKQLKEELKMVKRIANHLYKEYDLWQMNDVMTRDDIYHYGVLGLMDAKKKYDSQKNPNFRAYAPVRIKGEIIDALRKYGLVRLPQQKQNQVRILKDTINELVKEDRAPNLENIQEKLGWSYSKILSTEKLMMIVYSIDDESKNLDIKSDGKCSNPESPLMGTELGMVMERCMKRLKNNSEKIILMARELKNVRLKKLAEQFGCSIQTICNRHNRAKLKMRSCLEEHGWNLEEK
ncbi:MAG: sigma-70 family RNA polymerase sigma factor [Desulfobacterales bacterium]|nr:sigma-70 family RNA polymerase sigma factor [Desulfobacterales bacterium]